QEIVSAQAQQHRLEERLARLVVTAPHGGVITTPKLQERIGEYVKPGDLIAQVYAVDTVAAEIAVPEREIGDVRVGQLGVRRLRAGGTAPVGGVAGSGREARFGSARRRGGPARAGTAEPAGRRRSGRGPARRPPHRSRARRRRVA